MNHPRLIVLTLAALLCSPEEREAHVGDRVYQIPELTDDMLALIDLKDGSVDDWAQIFEDPALTPLDFSLEVNPDFVSGSIRCAPASSASIPTTASGLRCRFRASVRLRVAI